MKGYDFFEESMLLLGYTDSEGKLQDTTGLKSRAVAVINRILCDLGINLSIRRLSDEIEVTQKQKDAVIYGVAMLLAFSDGDGGKNKLFADIYNSKRAAVKGGNDKIRDTLPVGYGV
ncbi:MAG: hypothetical protein IJZ75_00255 [Clostridia bacterium]|nr:hypothetical protein [Clostridia bacterium]